ncbi:MAG: 3,4-dehydroadipyl-CoA semialdehyde dehydrogenase [Deltaproteobacteria bacterium]|nr:3,4-dehydroadipyl-CoA semialdehyde dehydrogenase [Deltaproteobacteria bacterium]
MIRLKSWVYGAWHEGGGKLATLVNPATEEVLGEASSEGVDFARVHEHARGKGLPALSSMSWADRALMLKNVARLFHSHREALLDLAQQNGGNTRGDAKFDIDGAIGTLGAYASLGESLAARLGDRKFILDGEMAQLTRAPRFGGQHLWVPRKGVAVHVNAFNFPAWGTFEKAAVAWLAGAPIVSKPATATALVAFRMAELLAESGLVPEGGFQLVCGSAGDLLSRLGAQDSLAFTGSNGTGAMLRHTPGFAERGVRVNVEADSLNAVVIGPDAEIGGELWSTAVRHVVTDMTQKTGQKCTAIRRVAVPESLVGEFEEAVVEALGAHTVGNPLVDGVTVGPVATAQQLRDVTAGIRAVAANGRVVLGGPERVDGRGSEAGKGYFVAPTVIRLDGAGPGPVHDIEVFGPSVSILPYDGSAAEGANFLARGQGSLVSTAYSDDRAWIGQMIADGAPWLGRFMLVSSKVADQVTAPGMVLPSCVHGGPGRAGGGEELGNERGLQFYMQRTALQGDRVVLGKILGIEA